MNVPLLIRGISGEAPQGFAKAIVDVDGD